MLDLSRIAVLAPYSDDVTETTITALEECGVKVIKISNFGIVVSDDISAVTPESIFTGAVAADHPDADGLFISCTDSCTDFRAAQLIDRIETTIGKPVITANQATFRQAVRTSGYDKPITGFGRLLEI